MKIRAIFDLIIIEFMNGGFKTIKLYSRHSEKYCRKKANEYIIKNNFHRLDVKQLIIVADPDAAGNRLL